MLVVATHPPRPLCVYKYERGYGQHSHARGRRCVIFASLLAREKKLCLLCPRLPSTASKKFGEISGSNGNVLCHISINDWFQLDLCIAISLICVRMLLVSPSFIDRLEGSPFKDKWLHLKVL